MTNTQANDFGNWLCNQFFDGRTFDDWKPADATPQYRVTSRQAFIDLANRYWNSADTITDKPSFDIGVVVDTALNEAYYEAYPNERDTLGVPGERALRTTRLGQWIKAARKPDLPTTPVSPGNTDEEKDTIIDAEVAYPMPTWRNLRFRWDVSGPKMEEWAKDDVPNIQPDVDTQIQWFKENLDGTYAHDFRQKFGSSGDEKEYVSALMRHKVERLFTPETRWMLDTAAACKGRDEGGCRFPEVYGLTPFPVTIDHLTPMDDTADRLYVTFPADHHTDRYVSHAADGTWYALPHHLSAITAPEENTMTDTTIDTTTPDEVTAETRHLRAENERLSNRLTAVERRANGIESEAQAIIDAVFEQAEKRGWCSEYESDFATPLNAEFSYLVLPVREKEFNVTWEETYLVTVQRSGTFTASDETGACEAAEEYASNSDVDNYEMQEAIRNGNFEHQETENFEAEEA